MTEREKMERGDWFDPEDAELAAARDRAAQLMQRLNTALPARGGDYEATLRALCPGIEGFIRAPFYCDYGFNIHCLLYTSPSPRDA